MESTTNITFRAATEQDMPAVRTIYDEYVRTSIYTFAHKTPTLEEMVDQWKNISETYPYIVAVQNEEVIGYAYAHPISTKEAYQWSVELTIYMDSKHVGHGQGKELYKKLLSLLAQQNVQTAYACIADPNEPSERMHRSLGFTLLSRRKKAGYKFGKWQDIFWMEKPLGTHPAPAPPIIPFPQLIQKLHAKQD